MLMVMLALDDLLKNPYETFRIADELRRELVGDTVTYVVNRNINFTDICINDCKFCSFRNRKKYLLSLDEIKRKVEEAVEFGCTELCIQGGLLPDADLDFYLSILQAVRDVDKKIHIHAFSPMEVVHAARNSGMTVEEVLKELKKEGLGSMPGTAAEILDDSIRALICPRKLKTAEWVEVIKTAHRVGIPTTATIMYGHIDTWEHRINHLLLIKKIQQETGGITELIPLPFMSKNNELGRYAKGSSGFDDLLMIAIARILLYPEIKNIQASWVKMGQKLAQAALHVGANDLGGTLMEENISKSAGATSGEFMHPEELRELIKIAGRVPKQRDTLYNILD
ncbi:5-amino-6-(D-ribitylamino)uracil--L-tyrosine 4-hydroxyphenyl transferase CofH [Archaeoglobus fulgidus]|uniref:5-amino-6-(D-ribitylamino)uracil--L-tyrosine 4-hydroxyphenyl transferase n=1 Tax=Archaeoglobus fulgidus DSM 8774 TaxID=1344584 RepID=A0A075WEY8_ARCFL|nr:5-amino-6-(D-ribitylamino)uracil--L-tyrosine 4-hydroxyphenyl transferase CofH [Archaeoglobus fulgidus]AIG97674.1 radical SAM domain protein, CofH subfamily [Archaeoglobus fulgidus DSM 8774]